MTSILSGQFHYTLNEKDKEWALRLLHAEASDALSAVCLLWLSVTRMTYNKENYIQKNHTFYDAMKNHFKSISPDWLKDGRKAKIFEKNKLKYKKREGNHTIPLELIDKKWKKILDLWLSGKIPNPFPGIYLYMTPHKASNGKGMIGLLENGRELAYDPFDRGTKSTSDDKCAFYIDEKTSILKRNFALIKSDNDAGDSSEEEVREILKFYEC